MRTRKDAGGDESGSSGATESFYPFLSMAICYHIWWYMPKEIHRDPRSGTVR